MHCYKHNFEYEFGGACPHCEAAEAERAAQRRFAEQQELQERLAEEQQELQERLADERREQQEELQRQQNERHEQLLAQIEEAQYQNEQREYERQQREEEQLERAHAAHEESLERDRRARIDHTIAANLRASARHLASGNAAAALEDAGRALDQDPHDFAALEAAYRAAKALKRPSEALGYLRTLVRGHIDSSDRSRGWSPSLEAQSQWLIAEAFEAGPPAGALVQDLVAKYRGSPGSIRARLAAGNRPDLYPKWLDLRITRYSPGQGDYTLAELLDEALRSGDTTLAPPELVKKVLLYGEFSTDFVEWACDRQLYDETLEFIRASVTRANAADRVCARIPLAIEVCRRARRPPEEWTRLLEAELTRVDASQIDDRPLLSAWLSDETKHTYASLACTRSGYRYIFAEWLLSHGHGKEANSYLHSCYKSASVPDRMRMIPQGIQACQQAQVSTTKWEDSLVEELRSLPIRDTQAYAEAWRGASMSSKSVIAAGMTRHVERVARCRRRDMEAAGLWQAVADAAWSRRTSPHVSRGAGAPVLFDAASGQERFSIVTRASVLFVGTPSALLWWAYTRDVSESLVVGAGMALVFWIVRAWYRRRTGIVRRSVVGRYVHHYEAIIESLGVEQAPLKRGRERVAVRPYREMLGALAITGLIPAVLISLNLLADSEWVRTLMPTMADKAVPATAVHAFITGDDVNVRTQPSKSARAVDALSRGAQVEILDTSDGWHLVRRAGAREALGWVHGTYVSNTVPAQAIPELTVDSSDQAGVTADSHSTSTDFAGDAAGSSAQMVPPATVVSAGACPFEGCQLGTWVATDAIPLRDECGGPISETMIYSGQSVQALESEVWATPRKGTVLEAGPYELRRGIRPGAEVYVLHPLGEGAMAVWYQGQIVEGSLDLRIDLGEELDWSWWVRVATPDGRDGWLKDPQWNFDGMTSH